ncbi:MAG TPA: hypothetical protein VJ377_05295 [Dehalococcoidales bacterium]|nr:MAG: hypothetical protein A2Z05_05445 [Chloroflexi bacterium RBG_16_60_22]HJX12926.1 hypothetical protein [Dehalococcoidales bacterium]
MDKTKYGKYIITTTKPNLAVPAFRGQDLTKVDWSTQTLYLDNEVIKGSNYVECIWLWKADPSPEGASPHTHDFNEVIGFCGTNFQDPSDLGGEIELWLGDEKHILTKSCIVFVPKGLKHCPLKIKRVDRPIFHFGMGTGKMYTGKKA